MSQVRLITPHAIFPDIQFASGIPSYRLTAFQMKLRKRGVNLPEFHDEQVIGTAKPRKRPRDKRRNAQMFQDGDSSTDELRMIEDASNHGHSRIVKASKCAFCGKLCKDTIGLKIHLGSCAKYKFPTKRPKRRGNEESDGKGQTGGTRKAGLGT